MINLNQPSAVSARARSGPSWAIGLQVPASAPRLGLTAGLALLFLAYGFAWYRHVAGVAFWMDEVLAVATARLPTDHDILRAIWRGAEFSPPTYDLILHTLGLAGPGQVSPARLLSLLAVGGTGLVVSACLRRPAGGVPALLGCGLTLGGSLFTFAIQARPYALLGLCLAVTIWLWLGLPAPCRRRRAASLWAVCALAVSLHVYGVLIPAWLAAAELGYGIATRRARWPVWLALAGAALALAAWLPLYLHLARFNAADTAAPDYYGRPDVPVFLRELGYVLWPHSLRWWPLVAILPLTAGCCVMARRNSQTPAATDEMRRWRAALVGLAVLPVCGFLISLFATGSFSPRYIAPVALLPALGLPYALRAIPGGKAISAALIVLISLAMLHEVGAADWARPSGEAVLAQRAPATLPIVFDQGLQYIQSVESLPLPLRARCVFVLTGPGIARPDPTNENQVARLAGILPNFHVVTEPAFLAAHPMFLLMFSAGQPGTAMPSLSAAGASFTRLGQAGDATLYLGHAR